MKISNYESYTIIIYPRRNFNRIFDEMLEAYNENLKLKVSPEVSIEDINWVIALKN